MTSRRCGPWGTAIAPEVQRRRVTVAARIFWACLLLVCAPAAVSWGMGLYDAVETRRITRDLARIAGTAADTAQTRGLADADWLGAFAERHDVYIRVLDAQGRTRFHTDAVYAEGRFARTWWFRDLADYFFGPGGPPDLASWEAELGAPGVRPEVQYVLRGGESKHTVRVSSKMLVFAHAQRVPGQQSLLYLTQISRRSVRALYDFRYQMLKLTFGLLLGALLMGGWLAYQIVAPIRSLESQVQGYLRGEDRGSLRLERSDEIGSLARSFDSLRVRLQDRVEHSTRVTEDLAHDLKSPLAAIRAASELLEGQESLQGPRRERLARTVGAAAAHMQRSIDALMQLARLEAQLAEQAKRPFDLADLVQDLARQMQADPRAEGRRLQYDGPPSAQMVGNPDRVRQAVQNLADNALSFAQEEVQIELRSEDGHWEIWVRDDGPGVSTGNQARVFERFFTRRPEDMAAGTGLGLSIVRAVARAHGGEVGLKSGPCGACFWLRLPSNCHTTALPRPPSR